MKKQLFYLFFTVSVTLLLGNGAAGATDCEEKLGGTCREWGWAIQTCPSGTYKVGDLGQYGCDTLGENQACCVEKCSGKYAGASCRDSANCETTAATSQDCTGGTVCCTKEKVDQNLKCDGNNDGVCRKDGALFNGCESGETFRGDINTCPVNSGCCIKECGTRYAGGSCRDSELCEQAAGSNQECSGKQVCCTKNRTSCTGGNCRAGEWQADTGQWVASCGKDEKDAGKQDCQEGAFCCIADGTSDGSGNGSGSSTGASQSFAFFNPLSVESFTALIKGILTAVQGIVGWLAVIFIVVGGIVYITSGGRSGQTSLGKEIITWALVGFAIAVAAPSLLKEIITIAGGGSTGGGSIDSARSAQEIATSVLYFLLSAMGLLAVISFIIGGVMYVLSMGDSSRTDTAKRAVLYSIVAVVLAGSGLIIVKQLLGFLQ